MKKILIPLLLLISLFAKAQVPVINDTVRYGGPLPAYTPQFNYGSYLGLRLPYSLNPYTSKTDLFITGKYLRRFYVSNVDSVSKYITPYAFNHSKGVFTKNYIDSLNAAIYSNTHIYTASSFWGSNIGILGAGTVNTISLIGNAWLSGNGGGVIFGDGTNQWQNYLDASGNLNWWMHGSGNNAAIIFLNNAGGGDISDRVGNYFLKASGSSIPYIDLSTNQTIAGTKTFTNGIILNGGSNFNSTVTVGGTSAQSFYFRNGSDIEFADQTNSNNTTMSNTNTTGPGITIDGGGRGAILINGNNIKDLNTGKLFAKELTGYSVATLPAGTIGMTAYVTDATAPTYLGTLTGGGTVKCRVFFNGTQWVSD